MNEEQLIDDKIIDVIISHPYRKWFRRQIFKDNNFESVMIFILGDTNDRSTMVNIIVKRDRFLTPHFKINYIDNINYFDFDNDKSDKYIIGLLDYADQCDLIDSISEKTKIYDLIK